MAVVPALTYPSKALSPVLADSQMAFRVLLVPKRLAALGASALVSRYRVVSSKLFYPSRPEQIASDQQAGPRMLLVASRRQQFMVMTTIRMRGFPIPYLPRGETAANYGLFWPRPVKPL